jgi:hypothetical protein
MERAGRLIGKLNRDCQVMTNEELARAVWPQAVGKKIAAHTAVDRLVRKCLVVEVRDMVWQRQLNTLRGQILKNLCGVVGAGIVEDLELRPMTPKRMPQRAETPRRDSALPDEADAIADPHLRRMYKISRKKATA